ncbi:hypothetical protein BJV78DRAFT_1286705 [Lactifluus subvellereus]|nr:hypothetical protein BJV78DRAFT_1286705 [Lactifluus subvellereus]
MSEAAHEAINAGAISGEGIYTTGHRNVPQSAQNPTRQGQSNFSDGSGPLFNMYVKRAEEDNKIADRWQKDADGILIFTGLFSAAVAALAAVSIQDLRPNSQDTSAFYLENIYQLLADPNVSRSSILAIPAKPPPFSPPKYAIWVNSPWFLSLVISLTCALLATLLQQWARRYLTITQPPRYSPHKRARIRAFFADGVEKFHLPWAVGALPTLLNLSLFLFFSGLLVFLVNINHTVFNAVVWWIGLSVGLYGCVALMPIFRQDSPYYAPLSSSAWFLYTFISYAIFRVLSSIALSRDEISFETWQRFFRLKNIYRERFWGGIVKTAQETASKLSAEIDGHVLGWTFDALDEDEELEQFFEGIPGFCSSEVVNEPRRNLAELDEGTMGDAYRGFLGRTLSSSFLSETIKKRRLTTCVKAADSARLSLAAYSILEVIFHGSMGGVLLRSVEIGRSLGSRGNNNNEGSALCAQGIVAGIIASVPVGELDYHWKALVMDQLGISEGVLRDYLAHGDSVLIANLIHITRQFFRSYLDGDSFILYALLDMLPAISGFDIKNTLPGLQHDFCALWNEIVLEARKRGNYNILLYTLSKIRHLYIALHQGTDSAPTAFSVSTHDLDDILAQPTSYPLCNIPAHASHIHGAVVGPPAETTLPTVPHPDAVLTTINPSAGPDVHIRLSDEPSLHDMPRATTIIESSHLTPPADLENNQFPAISLESATAATNQGPADTPTVPPTASSEFDLHSTPAAPTSVAQLLVTLPSSIIVPEQHNTDLDVVPHSIVPSMSFSSFSIPAPGNPLPADPQAASASPGSQIDQLTPGPEFLPLGSVAAFSFAAPQVTSGSHPNMASNDAAFDTHDNSRAPDFSSNMEAPHHPHQLQMSIPDIATEVSRRSLDTVPSSRDTDRPESK